MGAPVQNKYFKNIKLVIWYDICVLIPYLMFILPTVVIIIIILSITVDE